MKRMNADSIRSVVTGRRRRFGTMCMRIFYALFAVESVFLFPWAVIFDRPGFGGAAIAEMAIFVGVLALGLLYAWRKRVLRWT
jgi:NADH:ubiquinone oxidoreductase subunit 3 (subunit A)